MKRLLCTLAFAAAAMAQSTAVDWFNTSLAHHTATRYDDAIHAFNEAIQRNFQPVTNAMMRIARAQSMKGDTRAAVAMLRSAAENGFSNLVLLQNDQDFARARTDAGWGAVLRMVDRNGKPCLTDKRHRAFDFWIGDWAVSNFSSGAPAGENHVEVLLDGCLIVENWIPSNGNRGRGKSLNFFDTAANHWRQIYVSDAANAFEFTGEIRDGAMHYSREYTRAGRRILERMVFTPRDDGSVQQNWETSADDGRTWQSLFNGLYERKRGN